ncbi:hypothetical protein ILUMI_05852, partial [Ignelater luminosus]
YLWARRIEEDQDPLRNKRTATCGRKRAVNEENVEELTQKVDLTNLHRQRRLEFAEANLNRDWANVIFSDEKVFSTDVGSRTPLWRLPNTRYQPQNVLPSKRSGRITLSLWSWMSSAGPGELVRTSPHMDSAEHIGILENTTLPSVRAVYGEMNPILENPQIVPINWPPKSADLNPIANLWAATCTQWNDIQDGPIQIRNPNQLENHARRIWESHRGQDVCQNLIVFFFGMEYTFEAYVDSLRPTLSYPGLRTVRMPKQPMRLPPSQKITPTQRKAVRRRVELAKRLTVDLPDIPQGEKSVRSQLEQLVMQVFLYGAFERFKANGWRS